MCTAFTVLGVAFLLVVAPIWIGAHYLTRWRTVRTLSRADERLLGEVWESAQRMQQRMESLERILDADAPGWRGREDAQPSTPRPTHDQEKSPWRH
jgi:phage shock protein B